MMVTYASAIDAVTPHESESEHFDPFDYSFSAFYHKVFDSDA
jgi:hypothetical protein